MVMAAKVVMPKMRTQLPRDQCMAVHAMVVVSAFLGYTGLH